MNQLQAVLAVLGGLVVLAGLGGLLWGQWHGSDQDTRIQRLQGERDDYLSRLNFIEPRLRAVEQQNEVLMQLHNPADQIEALRLQENANHGATIAALEAQSVVLHQIDDHLLGKRGPDE